MSLTFDLPDGLPAQLLGDPLRLTQVLISLLRNAVKFTPAGAVNLTVQEIACDGAVCTLRFDVTDTGIGINREQHGRIFEPFTQADGSITRRFGGTGLGLSIVRRLVDMMGGTLTLESQVGSGSTFSVTLAFPVA